MFSIHHMKAGSLARRLLGLELGIWIGWAHPTPYHWVTVIGSGQRGWGHGIQAWPIRIILGHGMWTLREVLFAPG